MLTLLAGKDPFDGFSTAGKAALCVMCVVILIIVIMTTHNGPGDGDD